MKDLLKKVIFRLRHPGSAGCRRTGAALWRAAKAEGFAEARDYGGQV